MNEWLIVGLGNPGKEYEETRHNVGRMTVDLFRAAHGFSEWSKNGLAKAQEARGMYEGEPVRLLMPETYMNLSGESIRVFVKSPADAARLIVVHDDIDLPLGRIKISVDSGSGGHHGVESIIVHVMTKGFIRVRVGICPVDETGKLQKPDNPDFVVKKFLAEEEVVQRNSIEKAKTAIEKILKSGVEAAMSEFNGND
jgi:PTH1 family peptidyl-tRNA hydrolase